MPVITKLEAARRQLSAAIRLFFAGEDAIVVHSLASSAANLYSDLVERTTSRESWRRRFGNSGQRAQGEVKAILNDAWNFFKHADRDATSDLEFDEEHTELMLFYGTLECGELEPTTEEMKLFQLWFLRTGRFELQLTGEIQAAAEHLFPDLHLLSHAQQVQRGMQRLKALSSANGDA